MPAPHQIRPKVSGPFGLDLEWLERIESSAPIKVRNPKLIEPCISDLNEPVKLLSANSTAPLVFLIEFRN